MASIPVLDLRAFVDGSSHDQRGFVEGFGEALATFGFVTLDHHGVAEALVRDAFTAAQDFFALPEADKRACIVAGTQGNRGYVPFGGERAVGATAADLKEFFHVGQPTPPAGADPAVYAPNVWPAASPRLEAASVALYAALEAVALTSLRALARYLRLPDEHFASMAVRGNSVLRMIHYPPVPTGAPPGAVRAAAHEDINLITLLVESTSGGLELLTRDGAWIPVHALDGQIVLDAGDMLQRCTNGIIPSTTHRVVNPAGPNTPRYSMPFFTHPRPEVLLGPAPGTVEPSRPERFAPITAHDFLTERLRAITS